MTGFSTLYRVEGCAAAIPGDHRQSLHPVSYTHLDVYKRQGLGYTSFTSAQLALSLIEGVSRVRFIKDGG